MSPCAVYAPEHEAPQNRDVGGDPHLTLGTHDFVKAFYSLCDFLRRRACEPPADAFNSKRSNLAYFHP